MVQKVKGVGGSEIYFTQILPALIARNIDVEFVSIRTNRDGKEPLKLIEQLRSKGVTVHDVVVKSVYRPSLIFKLHRLIKRGNYSIVHSHLIHADFWIALVKLIFKNRFLHLSTKHGYKEEFMNQHGFDTKKLNHDLYYRISKFSEKYIDHSFAVSAGLRQFFIEANISSENKIGVMKHGFAVPQVSSKSNDQFRYSKNQVVIVGRLIPLKGHEYLIRVIAEVEKQLGDIKLIIVGTDFGYQGYLEKLVKDLKLTNNVLFLGFKSDVTSYIANSDVLAVSSIAEGFGLTILEAFNCETPVISFDVPACNEVIEHDQTGILIKPFDIKQYANELINLLSDTTIQNRLVKNGKIKLREEFSLTRMTDDLIEKYQSLSC